MDNAIAPLEKPNKSFTLDTILTTLFIFFPLLDSINGITMRAEIGSIAQPIKFLFLIGILLRVFQLSRKAAFFLIIFSAPHILSDFVSGIQFQDTFFINKDFGNTTKKILFVAMFFWFAILGAKNNIAYLESIFRRAVKTGFIIVALNLILGAVGLGEAQYRVHLPNGNVQEIGTRGFFQDGNTVAAYLSIFGGIISFYFWERKRILYIPFILFFLLLAVFKSTKVALLSPIITLFAIPLFAERQKIFKITKLKINLFFWSLLLLLGILPIVLEKFLTTDTGKRLQNLYERVDLATFIFTDRNRFLKAGWDEYQNNFTLFEQIFGKGYKAAESAAIYGGKAKTIEIDLFDLLFEKGVMGVFLNYGIWIVFLIISLYLCFFKSYGKWVPALAFTNVMAIFLSMTSGHIVGSGVLGAYYALFNAIAILYFVTFEKSRHKYPSIDFGEEYVKHGQ